MNAPVSPPRRPVRPIPVSDIWRANPFHRMRLGDINAPDRINQWGDDPRVGEAQQGVVGLQKAGVTGELETGLSVRYMGTNEHGIASHLVTRYFSAAVLTEDAIARLDNVSTKFYHEYVYPKA